MDIDELKKSWITMDKRLKEQPLVNEESIENLIRYASQNINSMSRFNYYVRIISLFILVGSALLFLFNRIVPDIFFMIIYIAAIPAFAWDIFTSRYLSKTKIDEQPIATVIIRFNKMHRWMIYERLIGVIFILFIAIALFIKLDVWTSGKTLIILFIACWIIDLAFILWIYSRNFNKLRDIKKNLNELKELKNN